MSAPDEPDVATLRPLHRRPAALGWVFAGGTVGAGCRNALALAFPATDGVPLTIAVVNLVGAFLLGLLLESLARRGPDEGRRRVLRLLVGTGFLGGFTTYSSLATDTARLLDDARPGPALGYALGTVLLGGLATFVGIALGSVLHRRGA